MRLVIGVFNFIQSEKFYLPVIYIAVGMLVYVIIAKMITNISKINNFIFFFILSPNKIIKQKKTLF